MAKKAQKKGKVEIIDAEIVEEITDPNLNFKEEKKSRKKPRGKRKKDFPEFTPQNREKLIQLAALGSPPDVTAKAAGIHPMTLENWLEKGRALTDRLNEGEDLEPVEKDFVDFYLRYTQVTANAVVSLLGVLQTQARKNPHIALKLLEKLDPENFGAKTELKMSGKVKHGHLHAHVAVGSIEAGEEIAKRMTTDQLRRLRGHRVKQIEAGEIVEADDDKEE